jgi:RND family efflux transporter MFP subunit
VKSVDAGTVVMPGMPIVTVEDPGRYRLEASVPEQLISHAQLGTTVAVNTGRGTFQGRVSEVVPSADTESRTFQVKIDLPRDCGCRSGEYGTAGIPIGQTKRMTVPRRAILGHGQLEGVFVAAERGIVEFRLVKTGKGLGERIEILAGLAEGERVATSQVGRLRDGVRVEGE